MREPSAGTIGLRDSNASDDKRIRQPQKLHDEAIDTADKPPAGNWRVSTRRPFQQTAKQSVTIRLDPSVVGWFKSRRRGQRYQTEINEVLNKYVADHRDRQAPIPSEALGATQSLFYSDENLKELEEHYATVRRRYEDQMLRYVAETFRNEKAREFATQGYARRLKTMARCIEKTFEILPPDLAHLPTSDEVNDCAIYIQAFVINVFGAIDNLAWVWVLEKGITKSNGEELSNNAVGFREKHDMVRRSLSLDFQKYLDGLSEWIHHMENYRHALAHRIPLYIPPHTVRESKAEAYRRLEDQMMEARRQLDFERYDWLFAEQAKLCEFWPVMVHSYAEEKGPVKFHAQLLADFATVEELGDKMLQELAR